MKKKFDWDDAITWKDYAKLCGISFIAGIAMIGISMTKCYLNYKETLLETSENETEE